MQKIKVKVISNLFSLIVLMVVILYGNISIAENLKLGERYKIIKPIYIVGLYDSRSDKTLSSRRHMLIWVPSRSLRSHILHFKLKSLLELQLRLLLKLRDRGITYLQLILIL